MHVFKLYNTKTENRTIVTVPEGKDSKKAAIEIAIKQHSKVVPCHNRPSNWKVEKMQIIEGALSVKPLKSKQPKAKSKLLMNSKKAG